MRKKISIVIPVYNEEAAIAATVQKLKHPFVQEIIVVDGGSTDHTVSSAEEAGCIVIKSEKKGRAVQMNAGAKVAISPILYFLHSDTTPPENYADCILDAIRSGADYGCFTLRFDEKDTILRFFALFTRLKMKWVRFGDQSLFVRKTVFEQIGGFDESLVVMEDQEIYHRLGRAGEFKLLTESVTTSARRYQKIGTLKLQFFFSLIFLGYYLGVRQKTLIHFYKNHIRTK